MANNTTYGIHRIQEANLSEKGSGYTDFNGTSLETFTGEIGDFFIQSMAGSYEIAGILLLGAMGYGLFTQDVSVDVQASVLIPLVFVMASGGFLPGGEGLVYAMLLGTVAIVVFGVFRFIS